MGRRCWLTPLRRPGEFTFFADAVRINPRAHGIDFILELPHDGALPRGVWVAWSGDGASSLIRYMPALFHDGTIALDSLMADMPHFDLAQGGSYLEPAQVEKALAARWTGPATTGVPDAPGTALAGPARRVDAGGPFEGALAH